MATLDVPLGPIVAGYAARGNWAAAHRVACLGVADSDWRDLAQAALRVCMLVCCCCCCCCCCDGCCLCERYITHTTKIIIIIKDT
jgi:hypothetical protein